ncbi:ABC transport protein [Bradyrhizobium oligotrophicum S58]|uniref:ABC transport protein n=1 Tax=Bradyrhizobium oligotrophicum S58 TaxID=1245469 RepID=M4Z2L9_9BRAD|nr:ABC transport protein [Bradyrhizobium oligotrophicum S58]
MRKLESAQLRNGLLQGATWIILASVVPAISPLAIREAVNELVTKDFTTAAWAIGLYVCAVELSRGATAAQTLNFGQLWRALRRSIANETYDHLLNLPSRFYLSHKTGETIQTVSEGLNGLRSVLGALTFGIAPAVLQGLSILVVLIVLERLDLLLLLLVFGISYGLLFRRGLESRVAIQRKAVEADAEAVGIVTDALIGQEISRLFGTSDLIGKKVDDVLAKGEKSWLAFFRSQHTNHQQLVFLFAATTGLYLLLVAYRVSTGALTTGDFVLAHAYILQIVSPIERLSFASRDLIQGIGNLTRLAELLDHEKEALSIDNRDLSLKDNHFTVQLEKVSFGYEPRRQVVHDLSFEIRPGETIAIVGLSGSGKSTIWRLICRLFDPHAGRILIGGIPSDQMDLTALRSAVAVVPQDCFLYNDTIANNILVASPLSSTIEVAEAGTLAGLEPLIARLPNGWDTKVGERGIRLSGGERQRVAIARAVLRRPRLFVFDEATSSLDSETEKAVEKSLSDVSAGASTLIIAHRLSSVCHADEILVLDHGRIIERGTHTSLLALGGRYCAMWSAQSSRRHE